MRKFQKILCWDSVWETHVLPEFNEFAKVGWSSPMKSEPEHLKKQKSPEQFSQSYVQSIKIWEVSYLIHHQSPGTKLAVVICMSQRCSWFCVWHSDDSTTKHYPHFARVSQRKTPAEVLCTQRVAMTHMLSACLPRTLKWWR